MIRSEDIQGIKDAASRRWEEVILALTTRVTPDHLDGKHHPCPLCGGTDRFRYFNDGTGGGICNKCWDTKNGDGISFVKWENGAKFEATARRIADHVGYKISKVTKSKGEKGETKEKPDKHLIFLDWHEGLVSFWAQNKQPVTAAAVKSFGGRRARYRNQYPVIAIPIWGSQLTEADPVGWVMYPVNGGTLPSFSGGGPIDWVPVKITYGSKPGIIGQVDKLADPDSYQNFTKMEGVSDALAAAVIAPSDHLVCTNSAGAKENPPKWFCKLAKGKKSIVVHDCDRPGQDGATYVLSNDGKPRKGWCPVLAEVATEVRNIVLPYPITLADGKDFRYWMAQGHGWEDFEATIARADVFKLDPGVQDVVQEAVDDPARLARVNLYRYGLHNENATLRFWRNEWYAWKKSRYRKIDRGELRAKIYAAVKNEFDNQAIAQQESSSEPVFAKKVTRSLIADVVAATEALSIVPEHVELGTWIRERIRERRNYVAVQNGILDIDTLMADKPGYLLTQSPEWFSSTYLPYEFDPQAQCPKWYEFLKRNFENDPQRLDMLQEWAGYLLLPDTGMQRFMILEGEGANGKSVFCAGVTAMLGKENVSNVSLDVFGDRFSRTQTLGKLLNITSDVGELDSIAEGYVKAFISGELMFFDRKNVPGIDTYPSARLMISCNNRPHWKDKSSGVFRRMIICPCRIQIPKDQRTKGMDKAWWWEQSGELPGILRWALCGLKRLREVGDFTESDLCSEALEDYRVETNPARAFLNEFTESSEEESVSCSELYSRYRSWCENRGHKRALNDSNFGREVKRRYPESSRKRVRVAGVKEYRYLRVRLKREEF